MYNIRTTSKYPYCPTPDMHIHFLGYCSSSASCWSIKLSHGNDCLLPDQSHERSKKDPGDSFRVFVHRAASAASKLAKHAYEAASTNKRFDDELLPLKCCLMSVSLPWDYIAHDLLHKVKTITTCKLYDCFDV
jgi:hypothetical protein